eukprot:GEMP01006550.1.p1 GENE.GEMP01006550.1~~GEMP01006550.1.p1  ORF type:complete len:989 (+),score=211.25 GEMP01006550.1:66-2969(+)
MSSFYPSKRQLPRVDGNSPQGHGVLDNRYGDDATITASSSSSFGTADSGITEAFRVPDAPPSSGVSYYRRFFMKPQGVHNHAPPLTANPRRLGLIPEDGELSPRAPSEISINTTHTKNTIASFASNRSVASNASFASSCAVLLHQAACGPKAQLPTLPKRTPDQIAQIKMLQTCSTTDAIFECLAQGVEDWLLPEAANICAKLHKRNKQQNPTPLWKNPQYNALLDKIEPLLDDMSGRNLALVSWALAVSHSNRMWHRLTELIPESKNDLDPISLTNVAWAFANSRPDVDAEAMRQLFYFLAAEVIRLLPHFQPGTVANFIWAFSKVGYKEEMLFIKVSEQCLTWTLVDFRPYDLCSLVWGFATAGYRDDKFLMALAHEMPSKVSRFNPQDLSNTIWAFSKLRFAHGETLHLLAQECQRKIKLFVNQDFTNVLYGLALLGLRDDCIVSTFQFLGDELMSRNLRNVELRHWCIMSWAFAHLDVWHPVNLHFFSLAEGMEAAAKFDPKTLSMVIASFQHWYRREQCSNALWILFDNLIASHVDLGGSGYSAVLKACETTGDVHREVSVLLQLGKSSQSPGLEAACMNAGILALARANADTSKLFDHMAHAERLDRTGRLLWKRLHPTTPIPTHASRDFYEVLGDRHACTIHVLPCGMTRSNEHASYSREFEILQYVLKHSHESPLGVLRAVDDYSKERSIWLKITGDEKAIIVEQSLHLAHRRPQCVVEIGCYVGYSAINMAKELQKWGGRLISLEVDPVHAIIARNTIEIAGLSDVIQVFIGHSCDVIPDRIAKMGPNSVDHVFMDQKGTRYHLDLQALENTCLSADATIVADNVLKPGAPEFLWHLHVENYLSLAVSVREYLLQSEDWVTIAFRQQRGNDPPNADSGKVAMPAELHRLAFKSDCMRQRSMWDPDRAPETAEWGVFGRHFVAVCDKTGCMTKPYIGEIRNNRLHVGSAWGNIKPVSLR